ncbi:MAG TPA: polysaccharide biosynthesis tyrosine autokinase [Bryobacteraceae bacterium]|nr:polysaccharide biosynthesis tyrosine autokinase [Bryobacteraceae bacterium]
MLNNRSDLPVVAHTQALVPQPLPTVFQVGAPDNDTAQPGLPLSHYLWVLRRHRWKILGFIAACVIGTLVVSLRLTPVYESTAIIDVDRQTPSAIIGQEAVRARNNDSDQFLATQIKLLQSDSVLRPVAEKFNLLAHEGSLAGKDNRQALARRDAPVTLSKLRVSRPPNTYLLLVSYRSTDPKLAADTANAVAQSYIAHTFNLRYKASSSLSSFMEKQLDEMKAKMERSTAALAQFEKELNVINPEEKTSILSARLLQLNTEYTNAQGDRVRKEAAEKSVGSGSMEAALASPQGESLRKLLENYSDAEQKFATIRGQYGANHPEYAKAAGQVAEIQRLLEHTRNTISRRVGAEYREARTREEMLRTAVAETKVEFDKINSRSFEYRQLKREAEADKGLYEELVRRIKEAGINASFQNSSIRLADAARPSFRHVFPNIQLNLLVAFLFATLFAVGAVFVVDLLDTTVRDPDEVARTLNTAVIGTLPAVRNWRKRLAPAVQDQDALRVAGNGEQAVSTFIESVRTLRNAILLADFDRRVKTILVTSASPAEGKSTTAAHLALAHAQQGKRTLLVDGDLRRPSIHRKFNFTPTAGLANVLLEEVEWQQVLVNFEGIPSLDIMPAGPPSRRASELMGSGITRFLDTVSSEYDLIIVDAPPMLGFSEPLQMATCADGVLIVARAGETNRKAISSVVTTLQRLRVNVLGLVLNEVKKDHSDSYYYYSSYGKYYTASPAEQEGAAAR